ncbi:MAG: M4 family metallopeptidase [Bacteroidota bacterium]
MMKRITKRLAMLSIAFALAQGVNAQSNALPKGVIAIERNSLDNSPKSLTFQPDANIRMADAGQVFADYLGISASSKITMAQKSATTTKAGITTIRYTQHYKGLKVEHGGYTLTGKSGTLAYMTGNLYRPETDLSSVPALSESAALTKALKHVGAERYKWQMPEEEADIKATYHKPDTTYYPKGRLVWVEDLAGNKNDRQLHLAYAFNIYADKPMSRQDVFIDAATGAVLFSNSLIKHTAATGASRYSGTVPFITANVAASYRLYDSTRGSGVHTRNMNNGTSYGAATEFTSATNTWPNIPANNIALDAHWAGEKVYDYFLTEHGRLSWDGADGILLQYVHYSNNYNNAYWNGVAMTYGDGTGITAGGFSPLTSMDVTAHEIGHGVCEATANLIYEKESGALNEGFSDCWGATIEQWSNPYEADAMPKNPWEIGEEIGTEPLRSMNKPLLQGQPNTYGSTNWFNVVGCTPGGGNDQCGVHTNSGLLNYWYYLLVNGGSGTNGIGNAYVVNPLGWTKSGAILYQTELALSSTATYADARTASINAATILYGACSPELQCVTSAWYAVGVGANYVPCTPQIGFRLMSVRISEKAPGIGCPASKTFNIGMKPYGPAAAGGAPVANLIIAGSSTAVPGIDYSLSAPSITFPVGDTSTRNITLTVYDNGAVNDNKHIDLAFSVTPNGSGAVISPIYDSLFIFIDNDDSIPHTGGILYPNLNAGIPVTSNFTSPFYGTNRRARSQYLLYANELAAAGVMPGTPITQIAFNVLTKSSTAPFTGFTVSMGNTTQADMSAAFVGGLTQVYTGNHTTNLGLDSIDFNTGTFTWDGTSNVAVQFCYGQTAASFTANDQVSGVQQGEFFIGDYNVTNGGTGTGCPLTFTAGNRTVVRPAMRFKQTVLPTAVETVAASTRTWDLHAGQQVYFYNPSNSKIIAAVNGSSHDLSCVTATVTQQGNGLVPASFAPVNRSLKEITITPTTNGSIATYDVIIYLTTAELAGIPPSSLLLVKTAEPTDATVTPANAVAVVPTLITAGNYVGFKATFTGFTRFFLVDGQICTTPNAAITPAGPTTFCVGDNVTLDATTGPSFTYQWQQDGAVISGATTSSYVASLAGDYIVTINQGTCDSTSLPVTITLDSVHADPIAGAANVCTASSTTYTNTTPGGTWSSSNTAVATVSPLGIVAGIAAGTAVISYSVSNGCGTAVATQVVNVGSSTTLPPITGPLSKCIGTITTLSNPAPGGTWSSSNTAIASINTTGVVTSTAVGTATITYTANNSFGCLSTATAVMTVNTFVSPSVMVVASPNDTVCTGDEVTYSAVLLFGGTSPAYLWTQNGINVATGPTYTATPANGDVIICTINSSYLCIAGSPAVASAPFVMRVIPPVVNTVMVTASTTSFASGAMVTFVAIAPYAGSYQWYVNGSPVPGATSSVFTTNSLANGQVVNCAVTAGNICALPPVVISGGLTMNVHATGINEAGSSNISVIPNPNRGTFVISGKLGTTANNDAVITVTNMLGQVVYKGNAIVSNGMINETVTLDASLANGMYLLKITAGDEHAVFHIVAER